MGPPPAAGKPPLDAEAIEERLEEWLAPVLSWRRTAAGPARGLAALDRARQEFVLRWVRIVARSSAEMAFQFASLAPRAFALMDAAGVEAWLLQAMDTYDKAGLHPAVAVLRDVEAHRRGAGEASAVALEEMAGILEAFVQGLGGRPLKVEASAQAYTDTETLFLPAVADRFPSREENFRLLKATAVHLWAQTRFGTWRPEFLEAATRLRDPEPALRRLHALETLRLDACIARHLPGVYRQMQALRAALGETRLPPAWEQAARRLRAPDATVKDSLALLPALEKGPAPRPACYQGGLFPEQVARVVALRLARERNAFRTALVKLAEEAGKRPVPEPLRLVDPEALRDRFALVRVPDPDRPEGFTYELRLDGQPLVPPHEVQRLMDSIIQDLGKIPDAYLVPAGDGGYPVVPEARQEEGAPAEAPREEGVFVYPEWDHERQRYRKHWCVLRETEVPPGEADFVDRTLDKYRGLVKSLRRAFEALRDEEKLLKKQRHGDDVDIDALVEAYADARSGLEMSDRLFTKMHLLERNIAVMFMVDMSGSTKGWVNEAEREALVLLCESLEALGDRYAIYGFSGMTRKRCEVFRIKGFHEPYGEAVKRRIGGITPRDYTRMGAAIRHLTQRLAEVDARTKLLITLSDGKPEDHDGYRGAYGIEDTRRALLEAKRAGIHPFCITIDTEARDYLPHMYGAVNYAVIDQVGKLPLKVSEIYRRLTT